MHVEKILAIWMAVLHTTQDSSASYDFVHYDHDPTPDYDSEEPNSHGTECSGVVGMASNSFCGIGVAHQAHIGCECILQSPTSFIARGS